MCELTKTYNEKYCESLIDNDYCHHLTIATAEIERGVNSKTENMMALICCIIRDLPLLSTVSDITHTSDRILRKKSNKGIVTDIRVPGYVTIRAAVRVRICLLYSHSLTLL